jgi:hypothetical protein
MSLSPRLKISSTRHPNAIASDKAAAAEGTRRFVSIALTPAREMPARRANSSWDQPLLIRYAQSRFCSTRDSVRADPTART